MQLKNIAIVVLILIIAGGAVCLFFKETPAPVSEELKIPRKNNLQTAETEDGIIEIKNNPQSVENSNIDLTKVSWIKIKTSRLAGFSLKSNVVEMMDENCGGQGHFLRTEGGLAQTGYCLAFGDGTAKTIIDSAAKLKEFFAPVDSVEKAVSFVAVTEGDYEVDGDIVRGDVSSADGYYLVRITQKNTFGCSTHVPIKAVFKVVKSGEMMLVSKEDLPQVAPGTGAMICAD